MTTQSHTEAHIEAIRKIHGTVIVVDIEKILANYRWLKTIFPKGIMPVLKADAYGMGAARTAEGLYKEGAKSIMLHNVEEVYAIDAQWQRPKDLQTYVLGYTPEHCYEAIKKANVIPTLKSMEDIENYSKQAIKEQQKLPCLLQIEIGLNRLGVSKEEQHYIIRHKEVMQHLDIHCIYGHLANAYNDKDTYNQEQKKRFEDFTKHFPEHKRSLIASQGMHFSKDYHYDFARIGAALHGLDITKATKIGNLKNVIHCYSSLIHVHRVEAGEKVGYTGIWTAKEKTTLGTITMGFADGLPSELALMGGYVCIEGVQCPYVGRISMDLAVIDLTRLEKKYQVIGQRVEVIGDRITPHEIGQCINKPPTVLLTGLNKKRYPWIYVQGNKVLESPKMDVL